MNQSAAKAPPAPLEPAAQTFVSTGDKREDLAARVKALDSTIKERTQQLEDLRNTDKCVPMLRGAVKSQILSEP